MPPVTPKPTTRKPPMYKPSTYYEIRKSSIQGKGGFAVKPIPEGTRIDEYLGEVISSEESSERYDDANMSRHHTFLFELGNGTCIDAAHNGNDARFINHSCDPNCEAQMEGDRIFIYSLRDIEPGTELLYDYRYSLEGPIDAATRAIYACKCGSRRCRGTILAPEKKGKAKAAAKKVARSKMKKASKPKSKSATR